MNGGGRMAIRLARATRADDRQATDLRRRVEPTSRPGGMALGGQRWWETRRREAASLFEGAAEIAVRDADANTERGTSHGNAHPG
jgi:hypothetical protein